MNNFEAIKAMNEKQMETFLAHVFSTGLNLGLYAVRQEECDFDELTTGCYDYAWLVSEAEPGTRLVFDVDGEPFMPQALVNAIRMNAGISEEDWEAAAAEIEAESGIQLKFSIKVGASDDDLDLEDLTLPELQTLLEDLNDKLDDLQSEEPEDEDSDDYEEWEEAVDRLEDQIDQVEDAIEDFEE